ncbi:flagellar hook-associated protein FlgK [Endothiovibrio diazotrophicus]
MAATSDLFSIGTGALVSYQRVLATTSHNISNVQNPDYSRQRVELTANTPQRSGAGFIGSGVTTSSVNRLYDNFLTTTVRDHTTEESRLDTFYSYASQVDDLLANSDAGLTPAIESFFNAVHDVANDPTSSSTRSVMLAEGESLADRFSYMGSRIDELTRHVGSEIVQTVSEINALAQTVSQLNAEIVYQTGASGGNTPNDLLDQRDAALAALAERINVETVDLADGSVNVFIGNGQNLVVGSSVLQLQDSGNVYDQSLHEITYNGGNVPITQFMTGGTLGGLLEVRDNVLLNARNELGRIALSVGETFNQQCRQGMDLNGSMGQDFFYPMATSTAYTAGAQVLPDQTFNANSTDVTGALSFTNIGNLTASNYELAYDGTNYTLTRLSDNATVGTVAGGALPQTLSFASEGFDVALSGTSITAGDSFLIRPTYNGARDLTVRTTDPAEIAAAAPFRIDSATDIDAGTGTTGVPVNTGSAELSAGTMSNATGTTLSAAAGTNALTLTFDPNAGGAGVPGFNVTPAAAITSANPILYDAATDNGNSYTVNVAGFGDVTFNIAGAPNSGDAFVIRDNAFDNTGATIPGGVGDARNATLLAALQTANTMSGVGGSTDYQGAYGSLVADVGIQTAQAEVNLTARQQLLEQAKSEKEQVSGVNLDEEAANLIKFQQAYQAAAQVLNVGRDVFQTLLAATGR